MEISHPNIQVSTLQNVQLNTQCIDVIKLKLTHNFIITQYNIFLPLLPFETLFDEFMLLCCNIVLNLTNEITAQYCNIVLNLTNEITAQYCNRNKLWVPLGFCEYV